MGLQLWWATLPSRMSPYILEIGSFRVGWYGMMYVAGFATVYFLCLRRIRLGERAYTRETLQDWLVAGAVGLIVGARLGYVAFYNPGYYLAHPLEIIMPFESTPEGWRYTGIAGMSYHGGVIGVFLVTWRFLGKRGLGLWEFTDFVVPSMPMGYFFGRLGNFINGELWGRATDAPWGMYFPSDPTGRLRHPSQLYEAAFEGIFLFAVIWPLRNLTWMRGIVLPVYIAGYGAVRFVIEFFREPDAHLGLLSLGMSMGQWLCLGMIGLGAGAAIWIKLVRN